MHDTIDINNILLSVIFSALGILIPLIFHLVGLGSIFLPMFLPLAAGACLLSPRNAFMMGFMTPLLSALLTGMPPFYPPVAVVMIVELSLFCLLISLLCHKTALPILAVLTIAILFDRVILLTMYSFILPLFRISFMAYTAYDLVKSLPGIVLLFILVPVLVPVCRKILHQYSLKTFEHNTHSEE